MDLKCTPQETSFAGNQITLMDYKDLGFPEIIGEVRRRGGWEERRGRSLWDGVGP